MKRNQLTILLFSALLLVGCGKTVLPSEDEKEGPVPAASTDDEAEQDVYSVAAFRSGSFGERYVWVQGYIVGACSRSIRQAEWEPPFSLEAAVLLADSPGETDPEKVISIQMVGKKMKREIALADNPENYGRPIAFYGVKQKYLGIPGMKKHVVASEWLDE